MKDNQSMEPEPRWRWTVVCLFDPETGENGDEDEEEDVAFEDFKTQFDGLFTGLLADG